MCQPEFPDELEPKPGESFKSYSSRAHTLCPNVPLEILQTWIFDHFDIVSKRWGWLDLDRLTFRREEWSTDEVLNRIKAWNEEMISAEVNKVLTWPEYQEIDFIPWMTKHGTWPTPPLILVGDGSLATPDGELVPDYWLIEGHHRLATLQALTQHPNWPDQSKHVLWLATRS